MYIKTAHDYQANYISHPIYLHPGKLTWNLKKAFWTGKKKENRSTNHQFLGSMLVFGAVNHPLKPLGDTTYP